MGRVLEAASSGCRGRAWGGPRGEGAPAVEASRGGGREVVLLRWRETGFELFLNSYSSGGGGGSSQPEERRPLGGG